MTSFNKSGFEDYGRQMLEGFDRYWPADVTMAVYGESGPFELPPGRFVFHDLAQVSADLVAFRQRHRDNPRANGQSGKRFRWIFQWQKPRIKLRLVRDKDTYRWQAVRFCHKPFSIFHAAKTCQADVLFWLDADMLMLRPLDRSFLDWLMPAGHLLSCIKRPKFSDCCVIAFNLRHPCIGDFFASFRRLYVADELFRYSEYHDSYLFDIVRRDYERKGCLTHDLAEGVGSIYGHVFNHCRLGHYMDHLKGSRKLFGQQGGNGEAPGDPERPRELSELLPSVAADQPWAGQLRPA